jgi:hypothetical protein
MSGATKPGLAGVLRALSGGAVVSALAHPALEPAGAIRQACRSGTAPGLENCTNPQTRPGAASGMGASSGSGFGERFTGEGGPSAGYRQLDQDRAARMGGAERQRQFGGRRR